MSLLKSASLSSPALLLLVRRAGLTVLLASLALVGCSPAVTPTLPPTTRLAPPPTASLIGPMPAPTALTTATVSSSAQPVERQQVTLTILHTNDVRGEIEPCG
jgi:2',3'-cyclic-nucleotide 2'-phosphodiesterase (5'-nucleotidase family)